MYAEAEDQTSEMNFGDSVDEVGLVNSWLVIREESGRSLSSRSVAQIADANAHMVQQAIRHRCSDREPEYRVNHPNGINAPIPAKHLAEEQSRDQCERRKNRTR